MSWNVLKIFETFLEGSVDYIIYRNYVVNQSLFVSCSLACSRSDNFFSHFFCLFVCLWSSVPRQIRSSGGHEGRLSSDPLPVFSAGGPCEQFWERQECPLFDIVHPAFPLPTTESLTLQGALKDGFGEAVVACDVPEPCKFPSLARRGCCGPTLS